MPMRQWLDRSQPLAGAPGLRGLDVIAAEWRQSALDLAAGGTRLLSLWTECTHSAAARALYGSDDFLLLVTLPFGGEAEYPGIADIFPAAARMQRAAADLTGLRASGTDPRPWLRHAAWPPRRAPSCAPTTMRSCA